MELQISFGICTKVQNVVEPIITRAMFEDVQIQKEKIKEHIVEIEFIYLCKR